MLKRIDIVLTEPLCRCEYQDVAWLISMDGRGKPFLTLMCNICETKLIVPNAEFRSTRIFEKPYPKGIKPKDPAPESVTLKPKLVSVPLDPMIPPIADEITIF